MTAGTVDQDKAPPKWDLKSCETSFLLSIQSAQRCVGYQFNPWVPDSKWLATTSRNSVD